MPRPDEIAWAAGFFEGEGCITMPRRGYYQLSLTNADCDMLARLQGIMGCGSITPRKTSRPWHKPLWTWNTRTLADVENSLALLWPWLSDRRRARWRELVAIRDDVLAQRLAPRVCLGCGESFIVNSAHHGPTQNQKYCSDACGRRTRRRLRVAS